MAMTEFFIGLAVGIMLGALLQARTDKQAGQSDLVQLLNKASEKAEDGKCLSLTVSMSKDNMDDWDDGDDNEIVPLDPEMVEKWRLN